MIITTICGTIFALSADMPRDYYPNALEGSNGEELKTGLHNLLKNHTRIAYGSRDYDGACTWTVFKKADVRPDGKVWDMYSNNSYTFSSGAAKGMNIEHSVPKSWWGDSDYDESTPGYPYQYDASYDLHHLVPSDSQANSAKSNHPLGEVIDVSFDNGVSKVGSGYANSNNPISLFEPADEYKGDFARMYLYFVTCYQDYYWQSRALSMFANNAYPTLNAYGQSLLLQWHRQDPVSDKEIDRNNAVYSFQGNRNPYIDYPNMVEYIWGDSIDYAFSFSGTNHTLPHLTASVQEINFGYIGANTTKEITVFLKGRNLTAPVTAQLSGDESSDFFIKENRWDADVVNTTGVNLAVGFRPESTGTRNATLQISCDDMEIPINIALSGTVLSSNATFLTITGMKASYRKSESPVALQLNVTDLEVEWTIDGKASAQLAPSQLSVGIHTIAFKTAIGSGRMRVQIVE